MSDIKITVEIRLEGQPTGGKEMLEAVLKATPEMTWQCSAEAAALRAIELTELNERLEVFAWDGDRLVGFATVSDDDDFNVGPCASIQSFYVLPSYRGIAGGRMVRRIIRHIKASGYEVMGFTQRLSLGEYSLRYIQL